MSYYRNQLEKWLKNIDVNVDSVLDIGGSSCPIVDRVKTWKVNKYEILDNMTEEVKQVATYRIDINYPIKISNTYDVIFCLEVAEYIFNPVLAVMNIYLLLKTNGIAYVSFPSIYPVHNPKEVDYLRYTRQGIIKILSTSGFSKWEIVPRIATVGAGALSQFYSLEKMHPVKNDDVIFDIGYMCKVFKS